MTRNQLDAIRARARSIEANKSPNAVWLFVRQDVPALLAEVEGMRESCTGLVKASERDYDKLLQMTAERDTAMDRMQQAIIDLLQAHNAPPELIARIVEMEYP